MEQGSKPVIALSAAAVWLASHQLKKGWCCLPLTPALVPMAVQEAGALAHPAHARCLSSHTEYHFVFLCITLHSLPTQVTLRPHNINFRREKSKLDLGFVGCLPMRLGKAWYASRVSANLHGGPLLATLLQLLHTPLL